MVTKNQKVDFEGNIQEQQGNSVPGLRVQRFTTMSSNDRELETSPKITIMKSHRLNKYSQGISVEPGQPGDI